MKFTMYIEFETIDGRHIELKNLKSQKVGTNDVKKIYDEFGLVPLYRIDGIKNIKDYSLNNRIEFSYEEAKKLYFFENDHCVVSKIILDELNIRKIYSIFKEEIFIERGENQEIKKVTFNYIFDIAKLKELIINEEITTFEK